MLRAPAEIANQCAISLSHHELLQSRNPRSPTPAPDVQLRFSTITLAVYARMRLVVPLQLSHNTARLSARTSGTVRLAVFSHRSSFITPGAYAVKRPLGVQTRYFQHLSQQQQQPQPPSTESKPTPPKQPATAKKASNDAVHITVAEQRRRDWNIIKRLSGNLWPKGDWSTRSRVVLGVGLLISAKVCMRNMSGR